MITPVRSFPAVQWTRHGEGPDGEEPAGTAAKWPKIVLKKAARTNRPPGPWRKIKIGGAGLIAVASSLYILNLPYPMIRWPVARLAPALLLPSFIMHLAVEMRHDASGSLQACLMIIGGSNTLPHTLNVR